MATADRILMLKLLGDTSSIDRSLRKTEGRMKGLGRSALSWGKALAAGLVIEGIDKVTEALGDAWDGFRDGQQAAGQLGATWRNLGLDGGQLQGTIDRIGESARRLGTDDAEDIRAFNQALQNTGGKSKQAMDRLRIAQDLVANGSAPSLTSALRLIDRAAAGSAGTVRRFGLTSDTAGGRIKELGNKVRGAAKAKADLDPLGLLFNNLNEDLEGIVGSLASGDLEEAMGNFARMGEDVSRAWGDISEKATPVLDKLTGGSWSDVMEDLGGVADKISEMADRLGKKLGPAFDGVMSTLRELQPLFQDLLDVVGPFVELGLKPIETFVALMLDSVTLVFEPLAALLKGDLKTAIDSFSTNFRNVLKDVDALLLNIPSTLLGLVPAVSQAALGIGRGVYDGIVGWVRSLPNALVSLIRKGVNAIIDVWNTLDFAIPRFDIPAIDIGFPSTGNGDLDKLLPRIKGGPWNVFQGTGDLIPDLARLGGGGGTPQQAGMYEKGLWSVPYDNMAAILHRGESVVPADFAQQLRANGGFGSAAYTINVSVAPGGDLVEAGRQMVRAIQQFERRSGKVWRSA